jgi:hypothetical protein
MRRLLVFTGLLVLGLGLAWPWISRLPFNRLPFGRLPGDFVINRPGLRIYLPLGTSLLASVVLSLLLRLLKR